MAQELLMECVHLVRFEAPYLFVQDIVAAPKPWSCLNLEELVIFIANQHRQRQSRDEDGETWNGGGEDTWNDDDEGIWDDEEENAGLKGSAGLEENDARRYDDEEGWVFEKISKLKRLLVLNDERSSLDADRAVAKLETLDFRLSFSSSSSSNSGISAM